MPVLAAPPDRGSMKAIFTSAAAGPARQAVVRPSARMRRVQAFMAPPGFVAAWPALARIRPLVVDANGPGCALQARQGCAAMVRRSTRSVNEKRTRRVSMLGLMMRWPLMISSLIRHADLCHGDT